MVGSSTYVDNSVDILLFTAAFNWIILFQLVLIIHVLLET